MQNRENDLVIANEILTKVREDLAVVGFREPDFTRLCAEEIRMQDRIARLTTQEYT